MILNLSYTKPIVTSPAGKRYALQSTDDWCSPCYRYEQVEYHKSVWLEMAEFVLNHPGCSAKDIRSYMGWAGRGHCDYFSTMIHDRKLMRDGRKYWLSNRFADKVREYINDIDEKLAKLNTPENCKRMTEEEYKQYLKRREVRALKKQIRQEAE